MLVKSVAQAFDAASEKVEALRMVVKNRDYDISEVPSYHVTQATNALQDLVTLAQSGTVEKEVWNEKKGKMLQTMQAWQGTDPALQTALVTLQQQSNFSNVWKTALDILRQDDPKVVKKTSGSELRKR